MPKLVVAAVVVLVGVVAYMIGASSSVPPAPPMDAPASVPRTPSEPEPTRRVQESGSRSDALLRELRDENRALRAAMADLTTAIRSARTLATPLPGTGQEQCTPEQWTARLRAREPDVVMETACRLREKMLTRALQFDAQAESAVGPIVGAVDATELQQAQRVQEANAKMYRRNAERCRTANKELDALRTLDDLARWRVTYADIDY